ncbi:hypothetical protein BCR33DRAFT_693939 [Rhizoclosmatium globosum]|uniref:Large ribosomal subunit protein uL23m n=1 Tax=Rhizoclosmatium globosum TaxID=329046 RepID=A0A1Y2CXZ7_9FUNG|nr:hypothetical protein HDU99_000708 [Rhizoclosmatium hyalinum]KAJ3285150.1 hypothetical protein HDU79_007571 [Rhizoclosmatium sp. JEL0117]ORY51898.1 hypothetical protein BCR33DRAFT_693939 [Rhizoclosmatium globosum]|eukprot:ORY51898.1 hypothetical protein BCR33DRAFT_693939 [Rhizoclosmatium globosum]
MKAPSLYFPSVSFRLVRSNLPPHQQVFRFPPKYNKIDITSLLTGLYGLQITDVRTMNYTGRGHYEQYKGASRRTRAAGFKKVIVTTKDDFEFPPPVSVARNGAIPLPPRIPKGAPTFKFRHLLPEPNENNDPSFKKEK